MAANKDSTLRRLMQLPGNTHCADCSANRPRYASVHAAVQPVDTRKQVGLQVTFGVFICDECFGSHRNVGTHVSRTKSVALDQVPPAARCADDTSCCSGRLRS